jgi:hypothetical protein
LFTTSFTSTTALLPFKLLSLIACNSPTSTFFSFPHDETRMIINVNMTLYRIINQFYRRQR